MRSVVDPANYAFSGYAVPVFLTGVSMAVLGLVTLRRERASLPGATFLAMTLAIALWLVPVGFVLSSSDRATASFWLRACHLGVSFIPATVFLFGAAVIDETRVRRWPIRIGFAVGGAVYLVDLTTTWIISHTERYYFGYYAIFSFRASWALLAYFAVYLSATLYLFYSTYRRTRSSAMRGRLRILIIGLAISYLATIDFLPDYHVPVYPFGYVFIAAFAVIGAIAIAKYRLVDITPALAAEHVISAMAEGLLIVDRDGFVRVANDAASDLWNLGPNTVGTHVAALDERWGQNALARLTDPERERHTEVVCEATGGTPRAVEVASSKLTDRRNVWVGTVYIIHQITERWQAERALRQSEERFRSLVHHATDLITVIDPDTTIRYQSPAIGRVLGVESDATIGTLLSDAVHRDDLARVMAALAELMAKPGSVVTGEGRLRNAGGEWRHLEFTGTDQRGNPAIGGLVLNARDVTERKRLEDELRMQARHDPVTGLANRYRFTDHLERALARHARAGTRVAVLYLDLDGFKAVNDRLGHTAGDRLLREVGQRLEAAVRAGDMVARLGGDEFAVVLEDLTSDDEASATAARILASLDQAVSIDGTEVPVSASIGIALPEPGESNPDRLLRNADVAMYAAKSRGRNRYEIYDEHPRAANLRPIRVLGNEDPVAGPDDESEWLQRDALTGAWNHAAIVDLVHREIDQVPTNDVSVAIVDVNGMTEINDTFGHDAGDRALRAVAQALTRNGAVVGRYGGDRFLALLSGTHRVGAQAYIADVASAVDDLCLKDIETQSTVPVTISAGVAAFPAEAATMDGVIRLAEGAMYAAKSHRTVQHGEAARRLADRVANLTDELTPLLTSPAPIDDKLQLVAERLSDGLGYDAAECTLFGRAGQELVASCALIAGKVTPLVQRWTDEQAEDPIREQTSIRVLLAKAQRPILIDDLVADDRLSERKRQLMAEMGLHSALVVPLMSNGELIGELGLARRAVAAFAPEDARFLSAVAHQVAAMVRMATLVDGLQEASKRLESAQAETVFMLAAAAEAHDRTTGVHLRHLRVLSEALARELGYDDASARELGLAAMLHDIGKISVPDALLASPLRFDVDDIEIARMWETMKRHSVWGAEFLAERQGFDLAANVARWHHERWDGAGYPDGLDGAHLPEEVTIVTVADAFDAMVSDRPYRSGRSAEAAVREIVACSGRQFNPRVVDALVRLHASGHLPSEAAEHERAA